MIKNIWKKRLKIIALMFILLFIILGSIKCFALGDVTDKKDIIWGSWKPNVNGDTTLSSKAGIILGLIQVVGILVSVGSIAYIGIKVILGSVEEKANYKQRLIPWLIGATMVFAITTLPSVIYNVADGTLGGEPIDDLKNAEYWEGFDDAIIKVLDLKLLDVDKEPTNRSQVESLRKQVQITSNYWKGYEKGLVWIINSGNYVGINATFYDNNFLIPLKNNLINENNINEKIKEIVNQINKESVFDVRKTARDTGIYNRLVALANEWNVNIDTDKKTWLEYTKGFWDACLVLNDKDQYYQRERAILNMIEANTYWSGYKDCMIIARNYTFSEAEWRDFRDGMQDYAVAEDDEDWEEHNINGIGNLTFFRKIGFHYGDRLESLHFSVKAYNESERLEFINLGNKFEMGYWEGYDDAVRKVKELNDVTKIYDEISSAKAKEKRCLYGEGYKDALDELIKTKESAIEKAKYYSKEIDILKTGKINKSTIREALGRQQFEAFLAVNLGEGGNIINFVLERLKVQAEYWDVDVKTPTKEGWEDYANGYDAAIFWIKTMLEDDWSTKNNLNEEMKEIKERYEIALEEHTGASYIIGYANALGCFRTGVSDNTKSSFTAYIQKSTEIVEKIKNGTININNYNNFYSNEEWSRRIEIQLNIWNNTNWKFDTEYSKEIEKKLS